MNGSGKFMESLLHSVKKYSIHIYSTITGLQSFNYKRGIDYVEFAPDRVAMQDATAQMALLQFIMAGKDTSSSSGLGPLRSSYYG